MRVWQDANDDVGGDVPVRADENPPFSDGYELLVYDEGVGSKPDAAYAQRDPGDPLTILFAVQKSLFDGEKGLLVGTWAATDLDPGQFDLNDHYTYEEAGSADPGYEVYYPIKGLSELDNSCRMTVGLRPDNPVGLGLCNVANPAQPGSPAGCQEPPGGCGPGEYWSADACSCQGLN